MELADIFKAVSVIEGNSYVVWKCLIESFPPNHFTALIYEFAKDNDDAQGTNDRLIQIVEDGLQWVRQKQDAEIQQLADRINFLEGRLKEQLDETAHERELSNIEIEKVQKIHKTMMNEFAEEIKIRQQYQTNRKIEQLHGKVRRKKEKIKQLKDITDNYRVRTMIQKWKLAVSLIRYTEQLNSKVLDQSSFKTYIVDDIKRIFTGKEIVQLQNSLESVRDQLRAEVEA